MSADKQTALTLVRAAQIEPDATRRTALAMAASADETGGTIAASMSVLARLVGLSTSQVRKQVHALVTMGVIEVTAKGFVLIEQNPEYTLDQIQEATGAKLIISLDLKPMAV